MFRWISIVVVRLFFKLFYHHKVYGKEHLPKQGGIMASNHASFFDPPMLAISCPYKIHFLARQTLFQSRFFSWMLRKYLTHPISSGKGNIQTIRLACELLEEGKKVVIFPEGKRSKNGKLQKGQMGVGMLVLRTQSLVIPVYIHGTYEIWKSQEKLPKLKGRTACVFGSTLHFSPKEGEDRKELQQRVADEIMEAIERLQEWYLAGAKGSPP